MFTHRSILAFALLALAIPAHGAEGRYLLHPIVASCVIGPCPDWRVIDRQTGEHFDVTGDFSELGVPSPGMVDLIADARRVRRERPNGGGSYDMLIITAIISKTPFMPGDQP